MFRFYLVHLFVRVFAAFRAPSVPFAGVEALGFALVPWTHIVVQAIVFASNFEFSKCVGRKAKGTRFAV